MTAPAASHRLLKFFISLFLAMIVSGFWWVVLVLGTLRWQVLDTQFVIASFRKHEVYEKVSHHLFMEINDAEGNSLPATPGLIQDFTEKNLVQVMAFLHGQTNDIIFYVPLLLQGEVDGKPPKQEHYALSELMSDDFYQDDFEQDLLFLNQTTQWLDNLLIGTGVGLLVCLLVLWRLSEHTFKTLLSFILLMNGVALVLLSWVGKSLFEWLILGFFNQQGLLGDGWMALPFMAIMNDVLESWLLLGGGFLILGGLSYLFIKNAQQENHHG